MKYWKLLIVLFLLIALNPAWSQDKQDQIKTVFVFNFTKYVQWPSPSNKITIGVLGSNASITAALKDMASKKSGEVDIVVEEFSNPALAGNYQIVYIPESNSGAIKSIDQAAIKETLLVTEKHGLTQQGSLINFVNQGGKLRFEINRQLMDKSSIKISSKLLGLAILV